MGPRSAFQPLQIAACGEEYERGCRVRRTGTCFGCQIRPTSVPPGRPDAPDAPGGVRMALERPAPGAPPGEYECKQETPREHKRSDDDDGDDACTRTRIVAAPANVGVLCGEQQQGIQRGHHPHRLPSQSLGKLAGGPHKSAGGEPDRTGYSR